MNSKVSKRIYIIILIVLVVIALSVALYVSGIGFNLGREFVRWIRTII